MRVGIAGLGRMGGAMAERLREVGHDLIVWNRSPEKATPLVEAGAQLAASPADLASRADVVLSILTDATAVDGVYRGPVGVLSAELAGKLVIEMSTVQPETEIALAVEVRAKGAAFVECPVGGTTGPARQGKLIGLVGGEAEDVERARPILEQLCRRIDHVGPVGAGASMKLAINLPLLVFYQALGEAYALCRHVGLDPAAMMDLFADTSGGPNILKVRGPAIAAALSGDTSAPPAFDVDSIRKDLRTMLAEGSARGTDLPLVRQALSVYDQAAQAGWG
jgi:3-hydroxyisobutyrate dehydrogenase